MPLVKKTFKLAVLTSGADASVMNFALDRILAARFAKKAVDCLIEGKSNLMTAIKGKDIVMVEFDKVIKTDKPVNRSLHRLAYALARH
jgi:6-phosphofructokinase